MSIDASFVGLFEWQIDSLGRPYRPTAAWRAIHDAAGNGLLPWPVLGPRLSAENFSSGDWLYERVRPRALHQGAYTSPESKE